jgi:16S rRNA pseudouridine516 synthase
LASTRHALDEGQLRALREGVLLHGEKAPIAAAAARIRDERLLEITVNEGKYHQVKRMIAAAGNRCESLHRARIGGLALPPSLAPGAWQWLDPAQLDALSTR